MSSLVAMPFAPQHNWCETAFVGIVVSTLCLQSVASVLLDRTECERLGSTAAAASLVEWELAMHSTITMRWRR
jgi:hypothetical protein